MIEVILGDSGSGKTTYIKKELLKYSTKEVAYLPQEVSGIFNPLNTIYSQIFEFNFSLEKFNFLLNKLNLKQLDLARYPYEFSTGELQRFGILIILLKENAKKIFLDEPTSSLDIENQNILAEILKLEQVDILVTTHNLSFASSLSNNIRIIINGSLEDFNEGCKKNDDFSDILEKKYKKIDFFDETFDLLQMLTQTQPPNPNPNPNLNLNPNPRQVVVPSKTILIFGKSGYGKTQFLYKIHNLLVKNNKKSIILNQNYGFSLPPHRIILKTLQEAINFREKKFFSSKEDIKEIIKIFRSLKLSIKVLKKYQHELSQGEKQRIAVIRAILLKSEIILLDEPTSSLDLANEIKMLNFLLEIQEKYNTKIAIVSHSNYVINNLLNKANKVIFFKEQFQYDLHEIIN